VIGNVFFKQKSASALWLGKAKIRERRLLKLAPIFKFLIECSHTLVYSVLRVELLMAFFSISPYELFEGAATFFISLITAVYLVLARLLKTTRRVRSSSRAVRILATRTSSVSTGVS
jgi:hypothetical protein